MMKTLKYIVLLTVMLVNMTPYIKDGKLEWKTTHAQAQAYTIEHLATNKWLCKDESFPLGSQLFISPIDCDLDLVCACKYCKKEIACDDTCKNMNCPDKIRERICPACNGPLDINNKCINCNCYNSDCYVAPPTGGGGGGGGDNPTTPTTKPNINILDISKWQRQQPYECKDASEAYLYRTGLTYVGERAKVYRLSYQNTTGIHPSYNSLNTITSVIDRHLDAGRGIIVGLNYRPDSPTINADGTDHFVVITGRYYDSSTHQYYYTYMDPGPPNSSIGCNTTTNRLYVDNENNTIHYKRPNDSKNREYTLTHIRPNDGNYNGSTTY